jgi:hypothetical protein
MRYVLLNFRCEKRKLKKVHNNGCINTQIKQSELHECTILVDQMLRNEPNETLETVVYVGIGY